LVQLEPGVGRPFAVPIVQVFQDGGGQTNFRSEAFFPTRFDFPPSLQKWKVTAVIGNKVSIKRGIGRD
jgi:hypothetical protein